MGMAGCRPEQAAVQVDGEVGAAALAGDGGEQVQGVGLLRGRVEHAPCELLRLVQVPGAVGVEGALQPPIEADIGAGRPRAARWSALSSSAHAGVRQVSGTGRRTPAASGSYRPRQEPRTRRSRPLPGGAKRGPTGAVRRARRPEPARRRMRRVPRTARRCVARPPPAGHRGTADSSGSPSDPRAARPGRPSFPDAARPGRP